MRASYITVAAARARADHQRATAFRRPYIEGSAPDDPPSDPEPAHRRLRALLARPAPATKTSARSSIAPSTDFRAGRIEQSLDGLRSRGALSPADAPYLWQRGIAQYYAGKFRECRDMFVSHRTVNPDDVENAAWHFLCVARAESPEAARKQMLPVGPDARRADARGVSDVQGRA